MSRARQISEPTAYLVRTGRPDDVDELAAINAAVHLQEQTGGESHPGIEAWTRDLFRGHPVVSPDAFLVAEEPGSGRPVASLVAIAQEWRLGEVRLPVVQVELVGTDPAHRGRRLTDLLFATLHERCVRDGTVLQVIEGIPSFYRRFGYEYALHFGGAPLIPASAIPPVDPRAGLRARPATVDDAEALAAVDRTVTGRSVALTCPRDPVLWRYDIAGRRPLDLIRRGVAVLEDATGSVVGYLAHGVRPAPTGELGVLAAACTSPHLWPVAAPVLLAYLVEVGHRTAQESGRPFTAVRPLLDAAHPFSRSAPPGVPQRPNSWYVRTGDPVALLNRLRPAIAERWRAAGLRWAEDTMLIDTYGDAIQLTFRNGELVSVGRGRRSPAPAADPRIHAAIPPGALLQLALGHRTLPQVLDAWPDCLPRDRLTQLFLEVAFPAVAPRLWQLL